MNWPLRSLERWTLVPCKDIPEATSSLEIWSIGWSEDRRCRVGGLPGRLSNLVQVDMIEAKLNKPTGGKPALSPHRPKTLGHSRRRKVKTVKLTVISKIKVGDGSTSLFCFINVFFDLINIEFVARRSWTETLIQLIDGPTSTIPSVMTKSMTCPPRCGHLNKVQNDNSHTHAMENFG